jgi:hypothetical protein
MQRQSSPLGLPVLFFEHPNSLMKLLVGIRHHPLLFLEPPYLVAQSN